MPTYGYRCPACGHDFDKLQKMSDVSAAGCPECGATGVRQISGGAGLLFKGSGFYETDYKRAGKGKSSGDQEKPAGKTESGADGGKPAKTDSAPAKSDSAPVKKDSPPKGSDS